MYENGHSVNLTVNITRWEFKIILPRVAKGLNIFGNFPWEVKLGNFGNV